MSIPNKISDKEMFLERHFDNFNIAGFTYHSGVDVFNELKIGTELILKAEPNNRNDIYAVAIYYENHKLGYIPRSNNKFISKFLNFGHIDLFDIKINRISPEEHPEQQIGVVVKIKDIASAKNKEDTVSNAESPTNTVKDIKNKNKIKK